MSTVAAPQPDEPAGRLWREALAGGAAPTIREDRMSMDDPAITMVDPRAVVVPPRLRPEDPAHTAALVASVLRDGVRSPIGLWEWDDGLKLIYGLHRLRAALAAGLHQIPAIIHKVSADEAKLLEIEENLIRHDLNALDRAVFLAEWKKVYDQLYPLAGKRGRKLPQVGAIAFQRSDVAKKAGLSKGSIYRAGKRIGAIAEDVRPLLAGTDAALKGVVLDALGALDHDAQRAVVAVAKARAKTAAEAKALKRGDDPATATVDPSQIRIAEAIRLHKAARAVPEDAAAMADRAFAALLGAWAKHTNPAARRRFFAALATPNEDGNDDLARWLPRGWGALERDGADSAPAAAAKRGKPTKQKEMAA